MRGLHEKRKTDGPSLPNQNTIIINIIYGIISLGTEKVQWNSVNKKLSEFQQSKNVK